jgi:transcriptional regulator with XRE-family HTH domain
MQYVTIVTFSSYLRDLIERRGLSPAGLAREIGLSHVAVGNYLSGRVPRYDQAKKLADFFGVSTDELLSGGNKLQEAASVYAFEDRVNWKQRALDAEKKIETLKKALQGLIREL